VRHRIVQVAWAVDRARVLGTGPVPANFDALRIDRHAICSLFTRAAPVVVSVLGSFDVDHVRVAEVNLPIEIRVGPTEAIEVGGEH
jgi:hypothetical protein